MNMGDAVDDISSLKLAPLKQTTLLGFFSTHPHSIICDWILALGAE
jgi:hypothetical protein